jgi:lipopolysaccharide exporter
MGASGFFCRPEAPIVATSLNARTVRGAAWTVGSGILVRAVGVVGTLVLTHYLAPEEYGAVSLAVTLVATANVLSTLGLGQYVASRPTHDPSVGVHATALHLGLGVAALLAVWALRGPLSSFLHAPQAASFVLPLCVAFMLERIGYVPERVLLRHLMFREVALARSASGLAYSIGSIALAALGAGAPAIVWGNVARFAVKLGCICYYADRRDWLAWRLPDRRVLSHMLRYGVPLSLATLSSYVTGNWDNLLISRWFGLEALGAYNLAYNLADTPATQIAEQAGDVLVPSYAQQTPEARRKAFAQSLLALSMIVTPLAVGLGIVAPTLVEALLDRRWAPAGPMLLVLATLSVVRPAIWISDSYLMAIDKSRLATLIEAVKLLCLFGALVAFGFKSPVWACGAIGVGFSATALVALFTASRADGMSLRVLLKAELAPLPAVVVMVLAVLLARRGIATISAPPSVRLAIEIIAGAAGYVGGALWLLPETTHQLAAAARDAFLRRATRGTRPAPAD